MWGGRFSAKPDQVMEAINASIDTDKRLAEQDIAGSKAHAAMLAKAGVISDADARAIADGLDKVLGEIRDGKFQFSKALEDIHMNVESRLKEIIGEPAGRLHTARSRNDQVALDFRLWVKSACEVRQEQIEALVKALLAQAEKHADSVMPGFTHLQTAQPVTFGHHLMAYVEMLDRDRGRFADAAARMNESPLGAAALAGTGFPIDRHMTAKALGFDRPMANSLDAVSARDFALEALAAVAICAQHLSRLAEEIVVWSSAQFGFVKLSDAWSTGSSIMPNKRNPDVVELMRGSCAVVQGALTELMGLVALPSGYQRDMQLTKAPVMRALAEARDTLTILPKVVASLQIDATRAAASVTADMLATDRAVDLARAGLPFREAYRRVAADLGSSTEPAGAAADASVRARVSLGAPGNLALDRLGAEIDRLDALARRAPASE
jgi:argininosuccinate lyase